MLRLTRRRFVTAVSATPLWLHPRARAATTPSDFTLGNPAGLTLFPSPEQPTLPVVAIALPKSDVARSVAIELPEHAWGRPRGTSEQRWFYRMYGTVAPALRPPVHWQRRGRTLLSTIQAAAGIELVTTVALDDDGVTITHRFTNRSDADYEEVEAPTCIRLYRPFTDVFLERTYAHHADGLELVASETPQRLALNAEEWLPVRYIVHCTPPAVPPDKRVERQDGITRYHKGKLADVPFLATESSPAGWVAASHTRATGSIFTNPARTCQHVDPGAPLPPHGSATLALKLYLLKGSAADAWRTISARRAAGAL